MTTVFARRKSKLFVINDNKLFYTTKEDSYGKCRKSKEDET